MMVIECFFVVFARFLPIFSEMKFPFFFVQQYFLLLERIDGDREKIGWKLKSAGGIFEMYFRFVMAPALTTKPHHPATDHRSKTNGTTN